jgi:phosphoserine phosphatase
MTMTKLLLVRHGHVEGIKPERFRGREPLLLTEKGRAEAATLARRIAAAWRPTHIYASPMERCVKTAAAIADACGIAAATCDDLNDLDYGAWQFKTYAQAEAENPTLFAAWFATPHLIRFPGGESLQDVAGRTANALRRLLARHRDDTVVLVGHDSVNRTLLLQLLDLPLSLFWRIEQGPCCLNEVDISGAKICIRRLNETGHLEQISAVAGGKPG